MNDWYFLSYKQWWAIFVHHVTWRVFLYLMVVVTNKRDTSRAGGLTEKKILPVYFVSSVKKNASVGKRLVPVLERELPLSELFPVPMVERHFGLPLMAGSSTEIREPPRERICFAVFAYSPFQLHMMYVRELSLKSLSMPK